MTHQLVADFPVLTGNDMATLHDLGDGAVCFRAHTKMNTFAPGVLDLLEDTLDNAGATFQAMVLANDDDRAFSAGADLTFFTRMMDSPGGSEKISAYGQRGQGLFVRMMRSPVPVVAAVQGFALGGGCEFQMHADATIALAEAGIGLPEAGIGLVPGWGGCTRLYARMLAADPAASPVDLALRAFGPLFSGRNAAVASEARQMGLLRPTDGIIADRADLLATAKARALSLVPGYEPPASMDLPVAGSEGAEAIMASVAGNTGLTATDLTVARKLANILTGGSAAGPTATETDLMALEVHTLANLVGWAPVRERIDHMLATGKRLKN